MDADFCFCGVFVRLLKDFVNGENAFLAIVARVVFV